MAWPRKAQAVYFQRRGLTRPWRGEPARFFVHFLEEGTQMSKIFCRIDSGARRTAIKFNLRKAAGAGKWMLVLAVAAMFLGACSDDDPVPVVVIAPAPTNSGTATTVPTGLSMYCTAGAYSAGALTINATGVSGVVSLNSCILYTFQGTAGITYASSVVPTSGDPDLYASETSNFTDTILFSDAVTGTDTVFDTVDSTGTKYLAVHGFSAASYAIAVAGP